MRHLLIALAAAGATAFGAASAAPVGAQAGESLLEAALSLFSFDLSAVPVSAENDAPDLKECDKKRTEVAEAEAAKDKRSGGDKTRTPGLEPLYLAF